MQNINGLTIAGTDPSAGAGMQADLKVFSALGVYATSIVTVLVAQNTCGVQSIYNIDPHFVRSQFQSLLEDVHIDVAKIGMLPTTSIIEIVAEQIKQINLKFIVLDTVMIAKSGNYLLSKDTINSMRELLLPYVSLITPNLPEAAALLKCKIAENEKIMQSQGEALLKLGCQAVLMKGGHLNSIDSPDWLITHEGNQRFSLPRVNTNNTHGTGCSLSSAIAALRTRYANLNDTVHRAKSWVYNALLQSRKIKIGKGRGPIHHFYEWWK